MNRKPVHVLSTFPASRDIVQRASKTNGGRYQAIDVTRPSIIGTYNYGMGVTDRFDQNLSYFIESNSEQCIEKEKSMRVLSTWSW